MEQPAHKRRLFCFTSLISPQQYLSLADLLTCCADCGPIQNCTLLVGCRTQRSKRSDLSLNLSLNLPFQENGE